MFLLSFLGVIFFGIAGILLIFVYTATVLWYIMTILCLCLLLSVLFLIDAAMILAFWKRSCNQCCCASQAEILYQKKNFCHPLCETVKYDLTTSISSLRIPSGDEGATPDHTYRKVGYGHRRQYVDCPTSAPSASKVDVAEVQTEPRRTFHIESQTQRSVKEIPVQTVSRCEMCNQQMQIFSTTADVQATMQSAPCTPCPALVQLIRGVPCCSGCRCVAGIVQVPQQSQQQQTQRSDQDKKPAKDQVKWVQQDQKSYGMLTSGQHEQPKMTGMAGTITKLTLASYSVTPSKKTHTSSQTGGDDTKTSKSTPTSSEEKKSKVNALQREQSGEKKPTKKQNEILIPEREKTKTTNDVAKQPVKPPPRKSISPLAPKQIKSSAKKEGLRKSVEFSAVEPVSILEEQSESTNEKPVSPVQQMAQVIDRLKEFEGSKMDQLGVTTEEPNPKVDTTIKDPMAKLPEPEKKEEEVNAAAEHQMKDKRSSPDETSAGQKPEVLAKINEEKSETKPVTNATTVSEFNLGNRESSFSTDKSESGYGKLDDSVTKQEDGAKVDQGTLPEPKPDTGTQGTVIDASLAKSKRTHILRKKNKVEPGEFKHADTTVQTLIRDDGDSGLPTGKSEFEEKSEVS
ncbi:uncharacterized protein LOC128874407 [Hylaeus volcanicus]|uniref:uncharacterized protein LOC128874407 n=1 Tax=Hylaeus volcanicus TaxID=313075 RepID=UPI0023B841D3|nr:uncharacterized protein LOC128874407 [Hylaeus volcanicus]